MQELNVDDNIYEAYKKVTKIVREPNIKLYKKT